MFSSAFVRQQDYAKTTEPISMTFGGRMQNGSGRNPLNAGVDTDEGEEPGIILLYHHHII